MEHTKLPWEVIKENGWGWCVKHGDEYVSFKMKKVDAAFMSRLAIHITTF
ncbi:MAG: hypothetical protein WC332_00165 [Clostridia bacterium]|jgi:hypothetical protein